MKYKELHSVEYDDPNWDEVTKAFLDKWLGKIENDSWIYYDEENPEYDARTNKYVVKFRDYKHKTAKYEFLVNWELKNAETKFYVSPLYKLSTRGYRHDDNTQRVYTLTESMYDEYRRDCENSFIEVNMPTLYYSNNESYHRNELSDVFRCSGAFKSETENRMEDILKVVFYLKIYVY